MTARRPASKTRSHRATGDARPNRVTRVLVANRGEISVRVIRACHDLGITPIAVFSEADRRSLHVQKASEAVCVGPAPARESYLNIDALLAAARETGADAIHPGYGFLAENADFAERVEKEGLAFIGPPSAAIRAMGSKIGSRAIASKAGVPVVPGTDSGSTDPQAVAEAARAIDGPVFIKASAGGGGKGLRLVTDRAQVETAARAAIEEAKATFGDGTVYVEKKIDRPRHLEFQILADAHGHVVHLFERECSIQRRHQKVLEETPSPALTPDLRARMGEGAVAAARAVGYVNAGTVEFMLDADGHFYFLEMNTRIQVEHPITECVTGIDLVQWQLRIARGEALTFAQTDLVQRGWAIECRIYAEDETRNFMPSCGVISYLHEPSGPGIRNDSGVYEGWEVTPWYDPILSKLIAYAEDREMARHRMLRALREYVIHGVHTGIDLHTRILQHPRFIAGDVHTAFFDDHAEEILSPMRQDVSDETFVAAALIEELGMTRTNPTEPARVGDTLSPWRRIGAWEIGGKR